ncbi:hypothetical protein GGR57DRAFT_476355 [Xylariaceae sp. FL1272]|nr:hypothetical protein GGR57DRAFT_476355 [Xylariaceae sp. FL1272]
MRLITPIRLLRQRDGKFSVFGPAEGKSYDFDIISYLWGGKVAPYNCGLDGVTWNVTIPQKKLEDIKRLMVAQEIQYMWADCVCISEANKREQAAEIAKRDDYYRAAKRCYILVDMPEIFYPQQVVDNLKFLDHVLSLIPEAAMASDSVELTEKTASRLWIWANEIPWAFSLEKATVRSAAVDMGVINCYSTCTSQIKSVFRNEYFSRVWTFQEMLLGKNVEVFAMDSQNVSCIGTLDIWMDLATDAMDKATKLHEWIENARVRRTSSVNLILRFIEEDVVRLDFLQTQARGIMCARTDIINGGPQWWVQNYKGVSNIFSAISLRPRQCEKRMDLFRGLLGIFKGLFTQEEIERDMSSEDLDSMSFTFFKQLSLKTGHAWTLLATSSRVRGEWDWIPVTDISSRNAGPDATNDIKTDIFAGVVRLGKMKSQGRVTADALGGITKTPRKYMSIHLKDEDPAFKFKLRGCNVGKKIKTGTFSSELIPETNERRHILGDETGRTLVQCATFLGSIMDPAGDIVKYRRRLLKNLAPYWTMSDPNAKPSQWVDRCVSGTDFERADCPQFLRTHNLSLNWWLDAVTGCESRLAKGTTAQIACEIRVNCGCVITAPFALVFEAVTAVDGSSLGGITGTLDDDGRITLSDGLGLVQVGDKGKTFNLMAFGGDDKYHENYADLCRSTRRDELVVPKKEAPSSRVLVREEFKHSMTRSYAYVDTDGSGNFLISRRGVIGDYTIVGVCIDNHLVGKKGEQEKGVTIR